MRGVEVAEADIDAPWFFNGETFLRVNGVDVSPLVGRPLRRAGSVVCWAVDMAVAALRPSVLDPEAPQPAVAAMRLPAASKPWSSSTDVVAGI